MQRPAPLYFENERLLTALKYADDPVASTWESVYDAGDASCIAYDSRGLFLAVGSAAGKVSIWSVSAGRQLVRVLQVPLSPVLPTPPAESVVVCLAWSCNSRTLFAGTGAGALVVWDISLGAVERVLRTPEPLRFVRPHPSQPRIVLFVPGSGMPWLCDWGTGASWGVPAALLPSEHGGAPSLPLCDDAALLPAPESAGAAANAPPAAGAGSGGPVLAALRVDACFHPTEPECLFVLTAGGALLRLACVWGGLGSGSTSDASSSRCSISVAAHLSLPGTLSPPELTHSRRQPILVVPTRAGVVLVDSSSPSALSPLLDAASYSEPVEHTPLVSARLLRRDAYVVALPTARSSHMSGGVYFFKRGVALSSRLLAGPPGGIVAVEAHPFLGVLVGLTSTGEVFALQQPLGPTPTVFPGPMYPPGFKLQLRNTEYLEAEDELDLLDERGRVLFQFPRGALSQLRQQQQQQLGGAAAAASTNAAEGDDPEAADVDVCAGDGVADAGAAAGLRSDPAAPGGVPGREGAVEAPHLLLRTLLLAPSSSSSPSPAAASWNGSAVAAACEREGDAVAEAQRRHSAQAVAIRRALSLILGLELPPVPPPAAAAASGGSGSALAVDAPLDPYAPLLLAVDPGLLLHPSRLQAATRSLDAPAAAAAAAEPSCEAAAAAEVALPPPPRALLVDAAAPLLAMPLVLPAPPVAGLVSRQYLAVLSELGAGVHGAIARACLLSAQSAPAPPTQETAVIHAARAAAAAAAEAARSATAALALPFTPPPEAAPAAGDAAQAAAGVKAVRGAKTAGRRLGPRVDGDSGGGTAARMPRALPGPRSRSPGVGRLKSGSTVAPPRQRAPPGLPAQPRRPSLAAVAGVKRPRSTPTASAAAAAAAAAVIDLCPVTVPSAVRGAAAQASPVANL